MSFNSKAPSFFVIVELSENETLQRFVIKHTSKFIQLVSSACENFVVKIFDNLKKGILSE